MATLGVMTPVAAKRLEGKVAIITGGDQGIGRAIALRLAAEGADIAFCYRALALVISRAVVEHVLGTE